MTHQIPRHVSRHHMKNHLMVAGLLLSAAISSWAGEIETDLNGFRLQQFCSNAEKALGKPFRSQKRVISAGNLKSSAYLIDDDAYMVVECPDEKGPPNIHSLQLTGFSQKTLPFKGLYLGDSENQVIKVLGKPDLVEKDSDTKKTFIYKDRNYSLRLSGEEPKLHSILIFTTRELIVGATSPDDNEEWETFQAALLAQDMPRLMELMRPDVTINHGHDIYAINNSWVEFIKHPDPLFVQALLNKTGSALEQASMSVQPEKQWRLQEHYGLGVVYKFPEGNPLEEISFFPYNGKYRVFEITLRTAARTLK